MRDDLTGIRKPHPRPPPGPSPQRGGERDQVERSLLVGSPPRSGEIPSLAAAARGGRGEEHRRAPPRLTGDEHRAYGPSASGPAGDRTHDRHRRHPRRSRRCPRRGPCPRLHHGRAGHGQPQGAGPPADRARALPEYGISVDDMEPDFKIEDRRPP